MDSRDLRRNALVRWPCIAMAGLQWLSAANAATLPESGADSIVCTNLQQVWSAPLPERDTPHRVLFEMLIYYYDPYWYVAWGECNGHPNWLPLAGCPVALKSGQRVEFDGYMVPNQERLDWSRTKTRILVSNVPFRPEPITNLLENASGGTARFVSVNGLIDRLEEDSHHLILTLLTASNRALVYVLKSSTNPPSIHEGDFVQLSGVYATQLAANGNIRQVEIWTPDSSRVQTGGSLEADPRFQTPVVDTDKMIAADSNKLIRVEGVVRAQEPGNWVSLWDASGQITLQTPQLQPLLPGARIEAIGYPQVVGFHHYLRNAVFRIAHAPAASASPAGGGTTPVLRLAEQVRDLTGEQAARHPKVLLHGAIVWSHAETPFVYLQDDSGGVRLSGVRFDNPDSAILGTLVEVRGEVVPGGFVPIVTNAVVVRTGWAPMPERGKDVTLEEAMTGTEDGRWIEMQGFVRSVTPANGLLKMEISPGAGQFESWVPIGKDPESFHRSSVRVSGVCASRSNDRGQLVGIQLWSPEPKDVEVIQSAPADLFAVPFRSLDGLRRFDIRNAVNQWIRTEGTVVYQVPGQSVWLQDGTFSLFAVSQETHSFICGDRLEAVGLPAHQGGRFVLRETAFRRLGGGTEPPAERVAELDGINLAWDGRLVRIDGILLNRAEKDGETRLLVRKGTATFEASLASASEQKFPAPTLELGSQLGLTGVYELQRDEYGNPRQFELKLRSGRDVELLKPAPWWTLARLVGMLFVVLVSSVLAVAWGMLISHKNRLLRHAQSELQTANDTLEHRVVERTRELQEQVAAKERAHAELAETQRQLMEASRAAGMAEVATGVLHNVGNVLNSANISVSTVQERLNQFRQTRLTRLVKLLREHEANLSHFLTRDTKGQKLIPYLETLDEHMATEQEAINTELMSLVGNIGHIKEIVTTQQTYARTGGVIEPLYATELVDDVLRMQSVAFARHQVEIVREFQSVPAFPGERHKIIQIVTNLLQNAVHACDQGDNASAKKVIIRVRETPSNTVQIQIADNGMGISRENLNRIFSFGFTTRKNGHGFGLHSCMLAAREMGGALSVASDGPGLGATFTLELPVQHTATKVA